MSFGKQCIISACLISLLFITTNIVAGPKTSYVEKAIEHTHIALAKALINLNKITKKCKIPHEIDVKKFKKDLPKLGVGDLREAIYFIHMRNFSDCLREAEQSILWLSYELGNLIRRASKDGHKVDKNYKLAPNAARTLLVGVSEEFSLARARYYSLPDDVRLKLDSVDELNQGYFNVMDLLEKL